MEPSSQSFSAIYNPFAKMLTDMTSKNQSTSVANALACIYTADESHPKFRYSGLNGILSVEIDRQLKTTFLRMYNLDTLDMVFECETYYGFDENIRKVREKFYVYDMLEGVIGFDFRTPEEGEYMFMKMKNNSKKMAQYRAIEERRKEEEKKKKAESTVFGKIGKFFKGEKEPEKHEETVILKVQKKNWISFDPKSGKFDTQNIPPEWAEIFKKLGYGKKQLEDQKLAGELMKDIMFYHTVKEAEEDPNIRQSLPHNVRNSLSGLQMPPNLPQGIEEQHTKDKSLPPPPPLPQPAQSEDTRTGLMAQICRGNFKLKPVTRDGPTVKVDASQMNKDEREDMTNYLLNAIKERNKRLHQYDQEEYDTVYV